MTWHVVVTVTWVGDLYKNKTKTSTQMAGFTRIAWHALLVMSTRVLTSVHAHLSRNKMTFLLDLHWKEWWIYGPFEHHDSISYLLIIISCSFILYRCVPPCIWWTKLFSTVQLIPVRVNQVSQIAGSANSKNKMMTGNCFAILYRHVMEAKPNKLELRGIEWWI